MSSGDEYRRRICRAIDYINEHLTESLSVAEIARLHDRQIGRGRTFFGNPAELRTPVPVADLIFSQPILRV